MILQSFLCSLLPCHFLVHYFVPNRLPVVAYSCFFSELCDFLLTCKTTHCSNTHCVWGISSETWVYWNQKYEFDCITWYPLTTFLHTPNLASRTYHLTFWPSSQWTIKVFLSFLFSLLRLEQACDGHTDRRIALGYSNRRRVTITVYGNHR